MMNERKSAKSSLGGGLIALAVVCAIGLGCFCNKDKIDSLTNGAVSNGSATPAASPSPSPSPSPAKAFKKADASKAEIPSDDELQEMVKKTLLDFNDAIQKEDFADFHTSISKVWQKQVTPEKLKESFQGFIDGRANISSISTMTAKFDQPAEVTRSAGPKTLETKGRYPTAPRDTEFELKYIPEGKEWKLAGLRVYTNVKR